MAKKTAENASVVKALLQRGARAEARDKKGWTALMCAAMSGDPASVTALLDAGLDVNAKDNEGKTALMWASNYGNTAAVRVLLQRGADVNAKEKNGQTAWQMAESGNEILLETLEKAGAVERAMRYPLSDALLKSVKKRHK